MADSNLQNINKVFRQLRNNITPNRGMMTKIAGAMHASVENAFATQGRSVVSGGWKEKFIGSGNPLESSGGLAMSIQRRVTEDSAAVFTNKRQAWILHHGGDIKAKKKLGSVKRKKDVWAMEQFFWHRYYATNKDFKYKILALHVHKYGKITISARPFMVLTDEYFDEIENIIYNEANK